MNDYPAQSNPAMSSTRLSHPKSFSSFLLTATILTLALLAFEPLAFGQAAPPGGDTVSKDLSLELGKGVSMKLALIPAGKFKMGNHDTPAETVKKVGGLEKHLTDEYPAHEVTISKPFYMGIHEVTQAQWKAVMGTEPWMTETGEGEKMASAQPRPQGFDDYPAVWMSSYDAIEFCRTLSKKTGRSVSLPSEAQWEYACRAGTTTTFSFGDELSKLIDHGWYGHQTAGQKEDYAHRVGQLKPNAWGLYDMHGNVWEFCRDWYDKDFYSRSPGVDPENTKETALRCLRSGSFHSGPIVSRSSQRARWVGPKDVRYNYGLRVVVAAETALPAGSSAQSLKDLFKPHKAWKLANAVKAEGTLIEATTKGNEIYFNHYRGELHSKGDYSDVAFKMEFMLPDKTNSGVLFLGSYEIQLSNSFGKEKLNSNDAGALHGAVAPKVNAARKDGEWQTLEVTFRAPRFAEDGQKTAHALFVKVLLNGQVVQENLFAKRQTNRAIIKDENTQGPIIIQGTRGHIAIRNVEMKNLDLSSVETPELSKEDRIPRAKYGRPKVDFVALGKAAFEDKGCIECHATNLDKTTIKTGPSLFGLLQLKPRVIKAIDKAEDRLVEIVADDDYISNSVRQPHAVLSLNKNDDNKPYLPIMVPYSPEIVSDGELLAITAYLKTLNPKNQQGPLYLWVEKPAVQYDISKDKDAVLVHSRPRLQRVNIGENHSSRAFHVGLPGNVNYSFDQRILGVVDIWNGPFIRLRNEKNGRAHQPSQRGDGAEVWKSESAYFQPLYKDGSEVDFNFREPTHVDQVRGLEMVADKGDFVARVNAAKARFLGVKTPKGAVPTFEYEIEGNVVAMQFVPSAKQTKQLTVNFKMTLESAQTFIFPAAAFNEIEASVGEIDGNKWIVPAGTHRNITFVAKSKKPARIVFTAGMDKLPKEQKRAPEKISWKEVDGKLAQEVEGKTAQEFSLLKGYTLSNCDGPKDHLGRDIDLFEPLGIDFVGNDTVFVSTRASGVWKIYKGEWHLFAEGTYESLGLVAENEHTIVLGEKTGLMRVTDTDGDHWADHRENMSDHFRFNGNYHEYLHGPVKYGDSYLYNLNLAHRIEGNYKGGGAAMGTVGGLRGWMCEINSKGEFNTFANGLRSPAGLAVSPAGEIVYAENQGSYVGTSKIFIVKKGKFYGNPVGLIDLPGMNDQSKEVQWEAVKNNRELPLVLMPQSKAANSPGSPEWDTSGGKFGPYSGKMFVGDQTLSRLFVVDRQKVGDIEQAALIPFAEGLASGAMRLKFNPVDHSLWIGQTGRGWGARGGSQAAFQKLSWDGTMPNAIQSVKATAKGFDLFFTKAQSADFGDITVSSWFYTDSPDYGSLENGKREDKVLRQVWNSDKTTCSIELENFKIEPRTGTNTSRVYHLLLDKTKLAETGKFQAQAFFTLHAIPTK